MEAPRSKCRLLPPRPPAVCKFCGQQFSTTQALGGHQNAHKQERAMNAAFKLSRNPFISHNLPTKTPLFRGFHYRPHFRYSPYFGYADEGWAPPNLARPLMEFVPPSSAYDHGCPIEPHVGPTNYLTGFLQVNENDDGLTKKPCVESTSCSGIAELDLAAKENMSSELDLTLKL